MKRTALMIFSVLMVQTSLAEKANCDSLSCKEGQSLIIAAVGDLLFHKPLQMKASNKGFESLWQAAMPHFQRSDIVYGNLEGPIATGLTSGGKTVNSPLLWDYHVYSGFPLFNYHPSLGPALKNGGFNLVSTANNHTLDRGGVGINKTIDILNESKICHVGTRKSDSSEEKVLIVEKKGFKIAWIACTEHTNGIVDKHDQVLYCYKKEDNKWIVNKIKSLKTQVDAIIVAPHWGNEYQERPSSQQKAFAHEVLNAGALAVIGSHPHVLQPLEKYKTTDNRDTIVMYSLGNFVSFQGSLRTRTTAILMLGLTKIAQQTVIHSIQAVPLYMDNRSGLFNIKLVPLKYPNGYITNNFPANTYR